MANFMILYNNKQFPMINRYNHFLYFIIYYNFSFNIIVYTQVYIVNINNNKNTYVYICKIILEIEY